MSSRYSTKLVSIPNGGSLSAAVNVPQGLTLVGIQMSAAWTAAAITFQGSVDGSVFQDMFNAAGTEVSVTTAAGRFVALDPGVYQSFVKQIKVRSGTSGAAVNQAAQRDLYLVFLDL